MPAPTENTSQREPSEVLYRGCLTSVGVTLAITFAVLAGWTIWQLIAVAFSGLNLVLAAFFGVMSLAGLWVALKGLRRGDEPTATRTVGDSSRQRGVLRTARKYEGRVTLAEITLETRLDVGEARAILDEFELHGVAELQISDAGREVYVFPSFLDGGLDKETARSILDEDEEVELLFKEFAELEEAEKERAEVGASARSQGDNQE